MEAWLVYFRDGAQYNKSYIQLYMEEGRKLGVSIRLILAEELEFGVRQNQLFLTYSKQEISLPDFVICRAIHPLLTRQLELMGLKVFNNSQVAELCNDKAKTCQYLAKTGIKMVDSSFYLNRQIGEVLAEASSGKVIKAVDGHGGAQVFLIGEAERQDIVSGLGRSHMVLQPFAGNRHQDLRVYVLGKEILAAVLRTSKEGFRANFSLGGEVALYRLSPEEKEIVTIVIEQFDFGLVGIDFIIGDKGELIFNEIEDVVGARMLYQCSDLNIAAKYLVYCLEQLSM
jgi:RimK family alpha-L-glutamate ligase